MAVQAQHPSNVLLLNRSEQERQSNERLEQPSLFFSSTSPPTIAGSGDQRKRKREATGGQVMSFFAGDDACAPAPKMVSFSQPPLVSTGLQLAFEQAQLQHRPSISNDFQALSFLSADIAAHAKQQTDEIDRLLRAHAEELRRGLAERRRRDGPALLAAVERRLREKEAEAERAASRGAELEGRLARLRSESLAWQAKAAADQAVAAALHAQLQQASTAARARRDETGDCGGGAADDSHSAHVDPRREEQPTAGSCRACRTRPVAAVLLPCRHLCLCGACDAAAAACPVCGALRTGSVHVFLS